VTRATGIAAVAAREVAWIRRDVVALLLLFAAPLLAFALLAGTFSQSVIRDLRIDVVDADQSDLSAGLVQAIDAAPGVQVARRSTDLSSAMHAIRSGAAIAAVFIPENFQRDLLAGRRPQLVNLYNRQFFTPGNIAASNVQAAINAAAADITRKAPSGSYAPGPLVVESYVLTNPALNYVQFLARAVMPTVLHVLIAISGAFSIGSEFGRRRDSREWIEVSGGNSLAAIIGKLAPYVAVFVLMMAVDLGIIHGLFGSPFRGDALLLAGAALLLIVGYLSLGAVAVLLVRNLALGLSIAGIFCSPAFGFAGVGFPTLAMDGFARFWGSLLPLRWYVQILFDQAARGIPPRDSLYAFGMLGLLAVVLFGFAALGTRRLFRRGMPAIEAVPAAPAAPRGVVGAFTGEYLRVLRDKGAFGLIIMGPLIYAVLYPRPYVGQLIRDVPIAVVDDDNSEISRTIVQALDAHEAIRVAARPLNLAEAEEAIARRQVFGVLSIPAGTEREVLKGQPARLPAHVDSAYFLLYNRAYQGIAEAIGNASADLQTRGARADGSLYRAALVRSAPVELLSEPLFNPTGGYASYVVPAAFVLILQQTLLMGVATLGGVTYETGGTAGRRLRGRASALAGQALAHLALALPAYAFYLLVLPHAYGYAATGKVLDLLVFVLPFILSVSLLGQFAGTLAKRRETAVILCIGFGIPLFFLVGVAWPPEAIPPVLRAAGAVLPSTFGIDGLIRINQMGATLADVSRDWQRLWILVLVYAGLTFLAARRGRKMEAAP